MGGRDGFLLAGRGRKTENEERGPSCWRKREEARGSGGEALGSPRGQALLLQDVSSLA